MVVRGTRSILHRVAMKEDADIHFMVVKYVTNKVMTREFQSRQIVQHKQANQMSNKQYPQVEDYHCPLCARYVLTRK